MNTILTYFAGKIIIVLDGSGLTESIKSSGRNIIIAYSPNPGDGPWVINYHNVTYNTVFLFALLMAVPKVNHRLRLKIVIIGMLILFPIQILRLVVTVFNYYGQHMQIDGKPIYSEIPRKFLYFTERTMARTEGQLIPISIWAGLFFYYKWHYKILKSRCGKD